MDYPLAFIAVSVFVAATVISAVAVAVVATVAAVIAPIVATVVSVVSGVIATIAPVIGSIIETIGGIVEGISAGIQGAVEALKTTIAEPLGNIISGLKTAIGDIVSAITEPLAPILNPIKESLVSIKDFAVDINTWVNVQLAPVGELVTAINSISAVLFVKQLIEGTAGITQVIGKVADGEAEATAQAIAMLYNNIVDLSISTIDFAHDQSVALAKSIDEYDVRLRQDNQAALAMLEDTLDMQVQNVTASLTERITPIENGVTRITRRTEDLPYFQRMLVRALA